MSEGADRRRYTRQRIASLTYIELGKDNGGIVVNLGEGGVAIAAASPLQERAIPELRFRLPGSAAWIKASAQIAWIGESRKEAGVSFLDLTEADRMRIRGWLSAPESPAPATPSFRTLDRSLIEPPAPQPELEPQPGFEPEASSPSDPGDAAEGLAADLSVPEAVPEVVPVAAPLPVAASPAPGAPEEVPQESVRDPWIRVELRLKRWLVTAILILLAALLSFFAGLLAQRRSWGDRLTNFVRQSVAAVSLGRRESPPANQPGDDSSGASLAQPGSPVPSPAEAPRSSQDENEVTPPPPAATSSAVRPPSAPPYAAPPAQPPNQPAASEVPAGQSAQPAQPANQAAAPPITAPVAPPLAPPVAASVVPVPETPSPAAAVPAGNPDAAAAPPATPAPIPTGTVEVLVDPYPSIRIPPALGNSSKGMPLQLGQLTTRVDPVYPQQALREGVQGVVQLHILMGTDGSVMDMQLVRGPELLVQSVRDAVSRWRYQPTHLGDQAVQTEADVTVTFRLTTPAAPSVK